MTPCKQHGDVFLMFIYYYAGLLGYNRCPLGGILSSHETGYVNYKKSSQPKSIEEEMGEISILGELGL